MNLSFSSLRLNGWRQFSEVNVDLHPRITVLTGANGAGKTTILNLFSRHFGWSQQYLATPTYSSSGAINFVVGLWRMFMSKDQPTFATVGSLRYSNQREAIIEIPLTGLNSVQYQVQVRNQLDVYGVHIPSHRPGAHYQPVRNIPTSGILPEQAYGIYHNDLIQRSQGGYTEFTPTYRMKEALISMAMFGRGNEHVQGNSALDQAYLGFNEVLRKILPSAIGFQRLSVRPPDVVLETESGDFLIDAASGGMMAVVDIAWRIHLFSSNRTNFVVTIDEPENHLHPSMQRSLLPNLLQAFPGAQFIVATHSPFIVSSVQDSNVYALKFTDAATSKSSADRTSPAQQVVSVRLDTANKAGSADEILREVLGVPTTFPKWVEESLANLVSRYKNLPLTAATLRELKSDMSRLGYGDLFPSALESIVDDQAQ
jgi:hypothetical protein